MPSSLSGRHSSAKSDRGGPVFSHPDVRSIGHVDRAGLLTQHLRSWGPIAAITLVGASALIFDALTPQTVSVGIFYVGMILISFWFPRPTVSYVLALLATFLIILGIWITIPDSTPMWVVLLNRTLSIGTVWLAAIFVYYTRALEQKLKAQVDITEALSFEMEHRIGNHLQMIASFLGLQAERSPNNAVRQALKIAGSRIMTIGKIQRTLSHSTSRMVDSKEFIESLINEARSALLNPDKIIIRVQVDSTVLTSIVATALGALLLESINNALKHAFPNGMSGTLSVSFIVSKNEYIIQLEDDGIGIDEAHGSGFGTQNLTDITHIMKGSITHYPACQSDTRPGTVWRLVIPA
jgi:two-component sensor histidine kinase